MSTCPLCWLDMEPFQKLAGRRATDQRTLVDGPVPYVSTYELITARHSLAVLSVRVSGRRHALSAYIGPCAGSLLLLNMWKILEVVTLLQQRRKDIVWNMKR
ncbi:hypothetical protein Y032_0118g733 [Ancylostoma ceylanicum]|uniref:Uncharacterized protein n=1 Tax=Ancylostoma ceylanicum TaxID=53326 RepID=A0A016TBL4_9BILA|nr:hypothetical protein Y032_0118g733 [Ancylostoma ceylanicum]